MKNIGEINRGNEEVEAMLAVRKSEKEPGAFEEIGYQRFGGRSRRMRKPVLKKPLSAPPAKAATTESSRPCPFVEVAPPVARCAGCGYEDNSSIPATGKCPVCDTLLESEQ